MLKKVLLASCGAMAFGACASGGGSDPLYDDQGLTSRQMASAPFKVEKSPLTQIDLLNLLDPENRRAVLAGNGLCGAHNLVAQAQQGELGSARSVEQLRDQYLFRRYQQIFTELLELKNKAEISETEKHRIKDLEKEKREIEREAKEHGTDLQNELKKNGGISASTEVTCAAYAFYTYYLSYPQFDFAVRDLSFYLDNDYLESIAKDGGPLSVVTDEQGKPVLKGGDIDLQDIESAKKYVESLSEYEQARLRAYLASGVYEKFYRQAAKSVAVSMRRNAIQDQIMVHSENYCRFFKAQLHETDIKVNLATGIASTLLGGLATIFTDPTTVRALAGSAAIVAGGQNKYNEVMFANLAVQTVIAGIDLAREKILREINETRFFPLNKDDIDELKGLDSDGVLNPGLFNTYGLRASIPWDHLYGEQNGMLTYAGAPVQEGRDKVGNLTYKPPIFTFSDLVAQAALQEDESEKPQDTNEEEQDNGSNTNENTQEEEENSSPVAVNDVVETKEDQPVEIAVLENDSDPDEGDKEKLKITKADAQSGKVALIDGNTKIKYTPNPNFHGKDYIRYWITDGKQVDGKNTSVLGFVDVTVVAAGEEPPAKKYLGLASVSVYSVESAVRDAIRFQTACSLAAGLTEATKAMEQARAPSVETLTNSLKQMEEMMNATEELRRAIDRAATTDRRPEPAGGNDNE